MCSLTSSDLMDAIEIILSIISKELMKGNIVELGDFGSFWLRINFEGSELVGDVTADPINNILPRFMPGTQFKRTLEKVRFSKS